MSGLHSYYTQYNNRTYLFCLAKKILQVLISVVQRKHLLREFVILNAARMRIIRESQKEKRAETRQHCELKVYDKMKAESLQLKQIAVLFSSISGTEFLDQC